MLQSRKNSQINFAPDKVTKQFLCEVELEYEKSHALYKMGQKENFIYPEPIQLKAETRAIDFKRIFTNGSIRQDYLNYLSGSDIDDEVILDKFTCAGKALANIHLKLSLSKKRDWVPPDSFLSAAVKAGGKHFESQISDLPCAFLHCDFGFENIEWSDSGIVIFDASPNYFSTFHTNTFGPVYIDIGNFHAVLCGLVPVKRYPFLHWNRAKHLQQAFINGYERTANIKCDMELVRVFSYASASSYLRKKYGSGVFHDIAMWVLFSPLKGL